MTEEAKRKEVDDDDEARKQLLLNIKGALDKFALWVSSQTPDLVQYKYNMIYNLLWILLINFSGRPCNTRWRQGKA